jgi:hypothetical protein
VRAQVEQLSTLRTGLKVHDILGPLREFHANALTERGPESRLRPSEDDLTAVFHRQALNLVLRSQDCFDNRGDLLNGPLRPEALCAVHFK